MLIFLALEVNQCIVSMKVNWISSVDERLLSSGIRQYPVINRQVINREEQIGCMMELRLLDRCFDRSPVKSSLAEAQREVSLGITTIVASESVF